MQEEIWKDIPDYEGLYKVSNLGRVKSLFFNKERIKSPATANGYYKLALNSNLGVKHFYIHRLVCMAFHENVHNKRCVNHINGNKLDNNVDNLEWATYKENSDHKYNVLNYTVSEETKVKISKSQIGKIVSEETRIKVSLNNRMKRKVICEITNNTWDSIKICSDSLGIDYSELRRDLAKNTNKFNIKYL